ncbi:MAG: hypothetical protein VZQ83_09805, partial [Eubacterium sp.]|nr:hypothetical protein [Eubacterium sp.]
MKRIMKTCGSIAIAAAMMFSVVGVIPAKAAETTITPDEFNTMAKQVAIATEAIAKNSPTKTEVTVNVKDLPLVGTSVSTVTESIDPINHTAKRVSVSSGVETETYTDIAKGCSYTFNKENDRYEVNKAVASTSAVSKLAEFDVSKFAGAVITVDDVKNGVATKVVNIKSALEGEALKAALAEIKGAAGGAVSALPVSSLGGFDLSSSLNKLSLDISLYIDDTYVLHSIAVSGTIGLDFSGVPLEIGI